MVCHITYTHARKYTCCTQQLEGHQRVADRNSKRLMQQLCMHSYNCLAAADWCCKQSLELHPDLHTRRKAIYTITDKPCCVSLAPLPHNSGHSSSAPQPSTLQPSTLRIKVSGQTLNPQPFPGYKTYSRAPQGPTSGKGVHGAKPGFEGCPLNPGSSGGATRQILQSSDNLGYKGLLQAN